MSVKKRHRDYRIWLAALLMSACLPFARAVQTPAGWLSIWGYPAEYEVGVDRAIVFSGRPSGYLKSIKADPQFGTYMQMFDATGYRGKRVRFSAVVKSENVEAWAGLFMRVDVQGKAVAFDNMQNRPIRGTQAWTKHSVVLDVDANANQIAIGVLLTGRGAVWINDVQFIEVNADVPVTDRMRSPLPLGGAVVASAWNRAGTNPEDYDMGADSPVVFNGRSSVYITSNKPNPQGFGTYMQILDAGDFRGKRVRFSAVVKSESVDNWAGLWMRVDVQDKPIAFDNMQNRPIKGTQTWTRSSVVLDVDPTAMKIAIGVMLNGRGAIWLDDVRFEEVGKDVPVTDMMKLPTGPRNLGFDE
jgi:hypothetical protein